MECSFRAFMSVLYMVTSVPSLICTHKHLQITSVTDQWQSSKHQGNFGLNTSEHITTIAITNGISVCSAWQVSLQPPCYPTTPCPVTGNQSTGNACFTCLYSTWTKKTSHVSFIYMYVSEPKHADRFCIEGNIIFFVNDQRSVPLNEITTVSHYSF